MPAALLKRSSVVLVVEDDLRTRELYRGILQAAGHPVVAVDDGLDALKFLEATTPAAVVLDLGLPRVSGQDVYREMKAHGVADHVPVVVVTGNAPRDIENQGFACVLRKPLDPDDLVSTVQRCIRAAGR